MLLVLRKGSTVVLIFGLTPPSDLLLGLEVPYRYPFVGNPPPSNVMPRRGKFLPHDKIATAGTKNLSVNNY